jgi:hypothetical protein
VGEDNESIALPERQDLNVLKNTLLLYAAKILKGCDFHNLRSSTCGRE